MKDSNNIVARARNWDGDRKAMYELLPDVRAARANEESDALRDAVQILLGTGKLPTVHHVQLEVYRVYMLEKQSEVEAYKHLLKAEEGTAELDRVCFTHGLRDPNVQKLKSQTEKLRAWFEEGDDFQVYSALGAQQKSSDSQKMAVVHDSKPSGVPTLQAATVQREFSSKFPALKNPTTLVVAEVSWK